MKSETVPNAADVWHPATMPGVYIVIVLVAMVGTFAYKQRTEGIFACPASGYATNAYLAYCQSTGYGDYDHAAFWFGLEPNAERSAADARVLFVGSSRLQFAFSTPATSDWFVATGVPFYLLGFSNTENMTFVGPLLARLKPRASVYVVNVDRFFDDRETPPHAEILRDGEVRSRNEQKKTLQVLHGRICNALPYFCGNHAAFFRTRETGVWELTGSEMFIATRVTDGAADNADRWGEYAAWGQKFISQLPVDRRCVILTIAPYEGTKRLEAEAIAAAVGLDLVAPQLDGLQTFDGSHLDRPSAGRWSKAFFELAGPRIRQCLEHS